MRLAAASTAIVTMLNHECTGMHVTTASQVHHQTLNQAVSYSIESSLKCIGGWLVVFAVQALRHISTAAAQLAP